MCAGMCVYCTCVYRIMRACMYACVWGREVSVCAHVCTGLCVDKPEDIVSQVPAMFFRHGASFSRSLPISPEALSIDPPTSALILDFQSRN